MVDKSTLIIITILVLGLGFAFNSFPTNSNNIIQGGGAPIIQDIVNGTIGPRGFNGTQGEQGEQGIQGIQGFNGTQGEQGEQGIQGIQGFNGTQGEQGEQGIQGIQGIAGTTGVASLISQVSISSSTTETQLIEYTIPANTLAVGTTYRIDVYGTLATAISGSATWRVRIGSNTLTGNIATNIVISNDVLPSTKSFHATALLTIRTTGSGGTCIANMAVIGDYSVSLEKAVRGSTTVSTINVATNANKIIEMTFQFGVSNSGNKLTVNNAVVELVKS